MSKLEASRSLGVQSWLGRTPLERMRFGCLPPDETDDIGRVRCVGRNVQRVAEWRKILLRNHPKFIAKSHPDNCVVPRSGRSLTAIRHA